MIDMIYIIKIGRFDFLSCVTSAKRDTPSHNRAIVARTNKRKINRQIPTTVKQLLVMVKSVLYEGTIALGTG